MNIFWIVLTTGSIAGAAIALLVWKRWKRQEELKTLAESLDLTFLPKADEAFKLPFQGLSLFQVGHSRSFSNCMTADSGEVRISVFDYCYTTGAGKHQHTSWHTIVALESAQLRLPAFSLRPENLFDRIGGLLGLQDIDFSDDPAFSKAFVLKGKDEAAIRTLFGPALRAHFVRYPDRSAEGVGSLLIGFRKSHAAPAEYKDLLKMAYETFGAVVDDPAGKA